MGTWFENAEYQPLGRQIYLAHRELHAELDARLSEHGASLWHWVLLREASFASGASQRELAERMGIEPPTLVGQLDKFVEDGYVERRRDDEDRRVIRIWLTPAGKRRLAALHKVARTFDAELRSLFTERELETMSKGLTRVQEHFGTPRREGSNIVTTTKAPPIPASSADGGTPERGATDEVIRTVALTKVYDRGVLAVDGLDLSVRRGEIFGLLGPNGAGKTTTSGMLTTGVIPTSGKAYVDGVDVVEHPTAAKQVIGVVPQNNTLDRSLNVWENLYFHGRFFGMTSAVAKAEATALLERFRLADRSRAPVGALSGGMAQRLMVARAVMHRPAVLFLDEPTAGLDPQGRIALWEILQELHAAEQTILLTTHHMEEADQLCDRLAIIDHGHLLTVGTPRELKQTVGADTVVTVSAATDDLDGLVQALSDGVPNVARADRVDGAVVLSVRGGDGILPAVFSAAERAGYALSDLSVTEPTLETVFITLTGKDLRE